MDAISRRDPLLPDGSSSAADEGAMYAAMRRDMLELKRENAKLKAKLQKAQEEVATAKAEGEKRIFAERRKAFRAVQTLQAELAAEKQHGDALEAALSAEKKRREQSDMSGDEANAHALAVQRELLSAQCQIETFTANAPSHLLQRVSRQAVLSGHGPPERCWSGAAGRAGAALASLAVEAGPTLLDAAQNPAMLSVTGLMTPSACTFEQNRISDLISTLYTSAAQATDHGTDTAKRDILEGSAESREARWTTSERLSAHRSLWFQDRSVQ